MTGKEKQSIPRLRLNRLSTEDDQKAGPSKAAKSRRTSNLTVQKETASMRSSADRNRLGDTSSFGSAASRSHRRANSSQATSSRGSTALSFAPEGSRPLSTSVTDDFVPPELPAGSENDSYILVGMDFGTTFSGVAWAWSGSPTDIKTVTNWQAYEYLNADKEKAPSEIFYNTLNSTSGELDATWGYGIPTGSEPLKWFKLLLLDDEDMDEKIRNSAQIKKARELLQASGKTAIEVIGDYLHFLWKHTIEAIEQDMGEEAVEGTPFRVILTVPAVWNHQAIGRMKNAAFKAGILANRLAGETELFFVGEPEAAALATFEDLKARDFKKGDTICVVDSGGGTVDLISYKVYKTDPLQLRECVEGSGGLCGAVFLDEDFEILMQQCLGHDFWNKIEPNSMRKLMHMDWENGIKRGFNGVNKRQWMVTLPHEISNLAGPHLTLEHGTVREIFDSVISQIRALVDDQVRRVNDKEGRLPKAIVLVGGFSSCQYLFQTLKTEYDKRIKVLKSTGTKPWSSICRGAVVKGLTSLDLVGVKVSSRISRSNYGSVFRTLFIEGEHLEQDKIWDEMVKQHKASNQLEWHLKRGDDIWDHAPVTVGRHRNVASSDMLPDGIYFWKESIYTCDLPNAPTRRTQDTKKLVDICAEVNIKSLPEKRNAEGRLYRSLRFKISMSIIGGTIEFSIMFNGKPIAHQNVDITFQNEASAIVSSSAFQLSSPQSFTSHSPSLIAPP